MENDTAMMMGPFMLFMFVAVVALYVYYAICLQKIAEKTNTENGWLAWVPIVNIYLLCTIAGKPGWWMLLCFIPYVNLAIMVYLWWLIAEARGKPGWVGLLNIVPVIGLAVPAYLAFSD
ncbi:MAG: DUF805 domain-containing protein [Candidatus Omnitrophica bacterium]|nr:DUF805 domain-containing protein [Candidatus Omnitrophota bacterium]